MDPKLYIDPRGCGRIVSNPGVPESPVRTRVERQGGAFLGEAGSQTAVGIRDQEQPPWGEPAVGLGTYSQGSNWGLWALGVQGPPALRSSIQGGTATPGTPPPPCWAPHSEPGWVRVSAGTWQAGPVGSTAEETEIDGRLTRPLSLPDPGFIPSAAKKTTGRPLSTSRTHPGALLLPARRALVTHAPWPLFPL